VNATMAERNVDVERMGRSGTGKKDSRNGMETRMHENGR